MTIKNNGQKRDTKRVLSAIFLLIIAICCLFIAVRDGLRWGWLVISLAIFYLSFAMFRSANEV